MKNIAEMHDDQFFPEWSVEEFDAIREDHIFSDRYQSVKREVIQMNRKKSKATRIFSRTAAALAACIALSAVVYAAAAHGEFFRNAFGNSGRKTVEVHENSIEDGKGGQVSVVVPGREYVPVDEETAEELIGTAVSVKPVVAEVNDHTLRILNAVRDQNAIVMEFTLECETGVTALHYDESTNESKGAYMSEQATFYFNVTGTSGRIYVDTEKTTETSLHGYYYGLYVFDEEQTESTDPQLGITKADEPLMGIADEASITYEQISIPVQGALNMETFTSESGGRLEVSPISMGVDMNAGLGLSEAEANDPINLKDIEIHYADGSVYQVYSEDEHVDNTSNLCGTEGSEILLIFNRLVDPENMESIAINGVTYTAVAE